MILPWVMTLDEVRKEWPVLRTAFLMAEELFEATNPGSAADLGIGPSFDELLEVPRRYLDGRVKPISVDGLSADLRDIGIYYWRRQAIDVLETACGGICSYSSESSNVVSRPA